MRRKSQPAPLAHRHLPLLEEVRAQLQAAGVANGRLLVGVSAGGDSMALLELCALAAPALELTLCATYVDHGLRLEAAVERTLVEAAAARLGTEFATVAVGAADADEDSLRRVRLRALQDVAARRGCRWIALGHTADDQIETVLMRFLRGAGLGGLGGMRRVRGPFVRPLMGVSRSELRRLLRRRGLGWIEDASNAWPRYARAKLRRQVIPAIERTFGSGALRHLGEQAERWRADQDLLDSEASRLEAYCLRGGERGEELEVAALMEAPPALRARVLHRWLGRAGALSTPDLRHVALVEALLENTGHAAVLDLPGLRVWCEAGRLRSGPPAGAARGRTGSAKRRRRVAASSGAC